MGTICPSTGRMGMTVRAFLAGDRESARESLLACGVFTEEEVQAALDLLDAVLISGSDGPYPTFALDIDGQMQGFACFGKTELTLSTWGLFWLCVHPEAQRQGAGRTLQAEVESFVRARGGERIVIETSGQVSYHSTREFYRSVGYVQVGLIRDFYKPGDDCVIFCKELV